MKANEPKDGEKEMDMFREEVSIDLNPFYCCGCGSCGPLPGYSFICPHCKRDVECRTGYPIKSWAASKLQALQGRNQSS